MPAETEKARRPALTLIVPPPAAGAPCNLQFDALIGRDGRIEKLQLIAFDHLAYSNLVFLSSALDALREARYPPALAGGQAVEAVTRIELTSPTNIPPPVSGVIGGVPGGLAGGTPGGVLGSMPPLPPPPLLKPGDSSEPHRNLVSVAGKVIEARLIQRVPPEYPDLAKRARVSGVVHLKAIINAEGKVENLELISGPALLAPAAIAAVKQWVYQPTLINGQPVAIQTEVDVNFTLNQ